MAANNEVFTFKQEIINSLTHALGILFGITCMPILINMAFTRSDTNSLIGTVIYGLCFLMVFSFSTLYHWSRHEGWKRKLEILDHISIYFLIAGTYTPFILIYVRNGIGFTILTVLWALTVIGTIFKIYYTGRWKLFSTFIYLAMGWILVFAGKSFFVNMSLPVIILVIAGGALYTIGVIFYIRDKYIFSHAIWHFFVLTAAICHYAAISLSV